MTDQTTPSRRAGLRDELVNALGQIATVPPVAHRREQADHVLAVLYREWPWLRAEAEDAPPADQTALRDRIAAALYERERPPGAPAWADAYAADREVFEAMADAVLPAVLAAHVGQPAPTAWVDGHPQLQAIATAVWEQCGRSDSGVCVEDDPRNIAVAALAATQGAQPAPIDRAAVLTPAERTMLDYALNQAQLRMWDTGKYTAEDQAALVSLRRLTAEQPAAGARQDGAQP